MGRNADVPCVDARSMQVYIYGTPFSHLFTELKISPIEVHISPIQLEISPNQFQISPIEL